MHPRVLIISPQVHPKPHSGVGMRGHFQAVHLSKVWPITLVTENGIYHVRNGVFDLVAENFAPQVPNFSAYARSLLSGEHYLYEKYNCRKWLLPNLADYSHIVVHYSALLSLLPRDRVSGVKVIFDTHNNEREYFESVAAQTSNSFKKLAIRNQISVAERVIRRSRNLIDSTISVSESDRNWVATLTGNASRHYVVPNNLFRYSPTTWTGRKALLYVGTLNVTMNLQALDWFVSEVWPRLKRQAPDVEFLVAGRDPSPRLVQALRSQGIDVIPNAPSLTPLYADAFYSLIPASSGSGAKIKVCESLAHGVPVLTTRHGLVGQPQAIKDCCDVREDPQAWVDAIVDRSSWQDRTSPEWKARTCGALEESYFGNSIGQIVSFIEEA